MSVSVTPDVEVSVNLLSSPASPLMVASLSDRMRASICASWARATAFTAGSELASGVTGVDAQNALTLVANWCEDRTADARSAAKMAWRRMSSFSTDLMKLLFTPVRRKRLMAPAVWPPSRRNC